MRWLNCLLLITLPFTCAAERPELALDEAVAHAIVTAPEVAAGEEAVAASRDLAVSAGRLPDPALIVGIENLPVEGPDAWSTSADFMTMTTFGLMQEFPGRQKRRLERERASAESVVADAELSDTRLLVARETARAWIRRATLESALDALTRLRADLELGATAARAGVRAGRASTAEALAAESAVVRLETRLLEFEGKARRARAELARWIGDEAERPLAGLPTFDTLPAPPGSLVADAGRHGRILPLDARLAAARTEAELARSERRPDWSAELVYGKRGPAFDDMASLRFTVDLPLFARHRQDPVVAARTADLRRLEAERDGSLRAYTAELRQMLIEWEQAGAQLDQFDRELLPLARERSRAALAAYRSGAADLRLAIDALQDEIDRLVERAELANSRGSAWAYLRYLEARQLPG
jgi:cobalt-zinc-cadmium efflux system outer membrane protein